MKKKPTKKAAKKKTRRRRRYRRVGRFGMKEVLEALGYPPSGEPEPETKATKLTPVRGLRRLNRYDDL